MKLLLETGCFYVVYAEMLQARDEVVSYVREAVKKGLERVKLKNLHCEKPFARERMVKTQA
jgi:hypothetical protein